MKLLEQITIGELAEYCKKVRAKTGLGCMDCQFLKLSLRNHISGCPFKYPYETGARINLKKEVDLE
ncbi:MAG: hypothetical protein V3U75_13180 [Methylococcaceae bacterium]